MRQFTLKTYIEMAGSTKPLSNETESCQNCKFHNKEKISCGHLFWHNCVVRDKDGYVVNYNYHHFR